jgi:hypothetical protein
MTTQTTEKAFESYLEETLINKECSCSGSFFVKSIIWGKVIKVI